jgi:hypothetical protein
MKELKKMNIGELKKLSRVEMKKIMAGSGSLGSGTCLGPGAHCGGNTKPCCDGFNCTGPGPTCG